MGTIAEKYADIIIVTEDNSRSESFNKICSDILSKVISPEKFIVIESRSEAIKKAVLLAGDDDIIALIGKGDEKYIIDNSGYHQYSEKAVVVHALKERKKFHENKT